jgi:hypothetical protein
MAIDGISKLNVNKSCTIDKSNKAVLTSTLSSLGPSSSRENFLKNSMAHYYSSGHHSLKNQKIKTLFCIP